MAKALGTTICQGSGLEVGMTPIRLTHDGKLDPVFGSCADSFEVFEWHGEQFGLPNDSVALAGPEIAPLQAFRYGASAYGLLFHLEMEEAGIDALCRECAGDLARTDLTSQSVRAAALPHLPRLHQLADRLMGHLLDSRR